MTSAIGWTFILSGALLIGGFFTWAVISGLRAKAEVDRNIESWNQWDEAVLAKVTPALLKRRRAAATQASRFAKTASKSGGIEGRSG